MRIVNSQALTEFFTVIATPKHFDQVTRQKKHKAERPEQIVDKPNHSRIGERNRTSVEPYVFCRFTCHSFVDGMSSPGRFSKTKTPPRSSSSGNVSSAKSLSVKRSPDFILS